MTATVKSSTSQVLEGADVAATIVVGQMAVVQAFEENSVTAQAFFADVSTTQALAVNKQVILGPPTTTAVKSSTVQILEGQTSDPTVTLSTGQVAAVQALQENSVTAQALFTDTPVSKAVATNKQLILEMVKSTKVSGVHLEVLTDSGVTPPQVGQRTIWFFN